MPEAVLDVEVDTRLRAEYEAKLEVWKAKELADLREEQDKRIQDEVSKLFLKWQEEQKPLSLDDIKKLLDQEYLEIPIKIPLPDDAGEVQNQTFVIRELPQSVERKFYKQFRTRVKEVGPELAAMVQKNMDTPFEKQIEGFLNTFDGAFDVLADGVVLILNPFGKKAEVTTEWVQNNISSNRQYSIILAQIEVNRLRDFFSRLFQSGQKAGTMMTPLNFQQLQRLVR
jgi:hypothetical protein